MAKNEMVVMENNNNVEINYNDVIINNITIWK